MPVVPPFKVPPGDRERVEPAPSTEPKLNSLSISMQPPIIPILPLDTSIGIAGTRTDTASQHDGYEDLSSGNIISNITWKPDTSRILLLCGGSDDRPDSLSNLFKTVAGFEPTNYDTANGPQFDIVDDSVWDKLHSESTSLEYVGCVACPPCGPMSKLHSLPGPPPLFDVKGPGRYGRSDLSPRSKERVRKHILLTTRVAQMLTHFTRLRIPWIFEAPWTTDNEVSALNLDEFVSLLAMDGVVKTLGYQCPFGGRSPKPTAWVTFGVDVSAMPSNSPHPICTWYNQRNGVAVNKAHAPTSGKDVYLRTPNVLAPRDRPWPNPSGLTPWVAQKLERTDVVAMISSIEAVVA